MSAAVHLAKGDRERVIGAEDRRRGEHEHRCVRLSFLGMDAPGSGRVAVEGVLNRPALLIEVGAGAGDLHHGRLAAGGEDAGVELREMEVAVVGPPRALHRERIVGEEVEAKGRDRRVRAAEGDRDYFLLRRRATTENRAVVEPLEFGAKGRGERGQRGRRPHGPRLARALPGVDNRHVFRGVEEGFRGGGGLGRHALPAFAGGGDEAVGIPVDLPLADAGEDGLKGVVVFL